MGSEACGIPFIPFAIDGSVADWHEAAVVVEMVDGALSTGVKGGTGTCGTIHDDAYSWHSGGLLPSY
jgi:hypothetical protein